LTQKNKKQSCRKGTPNQIQKFALKMLLKPFWLEEQEMEKYMNKIIEYETKVLEFINLLVITIENKPYFTKINLS
jgi:hypothetical protein